MLSHESLSQRFSVCIPLNATTLVAAGDLARKGSVQAEEPRFRAAAGRTCEAGGGDALLGHAQRVPKRRAELLHVRRRRRVHNRAEACGAAATVVDDRSSFIETAAVNLSSAPPPACRTLLKPAAATAMGAMSKHVSRP